MSASGSDNTMRIAEVFREKKPHTRFEKINISSQTHGFENKALAIRFQFENKALAIRFQFENKALALRHTGSLVAQTYSQQTFFYAFSQRDFRFVKNMVLLTIYHLIISQTTFHLVHNQKEIIRSNFNKSYKIYA